MDSPTETVGLSDLECEAAAAPLGIDLPPVVHDLEALVIHRNLGKRADEFLVGATQHADERLCRRVVVRFDAFDLDVAVKPSYGVDSLLAVRRATPYPETHVVHLTCNLQPVRPAALKVLHVVRPSEAERFDLVEVKNLGCDHRSTTPID
jgi:hypothetical protein